MWHLQKHGIPLNSQPAFKLTLYLLHTHLYVSVITNVFDDFTFADEWLSDLGEYEIVIPKRVDSQGYPYGSEDHYRTRRKRSVSPQDAHNHTEDFSSAVYYHLEAFGRKFEMQLTPSEDFISPNMIVQHIDGNETWLEDKENIPSGMGCFHRGVIKNDPRSVVALSICDSLVSFCFHLLNFVVSKKKEIYEEYVNT